MNPYASGSCWQCGKKLTAENYHREGRCPDCAKATHCCRNCRFYTPGKPNDCAEINLDPVPDKERPNFCEYFEPTPTPLRRPSSPQEDLRRAAEALFKR